MHWTLFSYTSDDGSIMLLPLLRQLKTYHSHTTHQTVTAVNMLRARDWQLWLTHCLLIPSTHALQLQFQNQPLNSCTTTLLWVSDLIHLSPCLSLPTLPFPSTWLVQYTQALKGILTQVYSLPLLPPLPLPSPFTWYTQT